MSSLILRPLSSLILRPLEKVPHQKYFVQVNGVDVEVPGGSTVAKLGGESSGMIHAAWKLGMEGRRYREEWDEASEIGDITHAFIRGNLEGCEVDLRFCKNPSTIETARQCASKGLWFVQENDFDIIAVENQLSRPIVLPDGTPYGYGGTIDLVVRATKESEDYSFGDIILVDWKSSKGLYPIPNYCQIIGYEKLWNFCSGDKLQASKRVVVRIGKGDGADYQERWIKKSEQVERYWQIFQGQLLLWHRMLTPKK